MLAGGICYSTPMRILVMSDSHGNFPTALQACDLADGFNALVHLGDGAEDAAILAHAVDVTVMHLAGNCDQGSSSPRELLWECEGKKLLMLHGDAYGVKSGLALLERRAREAGADAVLFGHTHRPLVAMLSGMLVVNPGTLMRSALKKSFAIVEISSAGISARLHDIA